MNRKKDEIYVYETLLCLFVIMIHLLSEGVVNYERPSTLSVLFCSVSSLLSFVVPAFILSSGIKTFLKMGAEEFHYFQFIKKRMTKIYIPYLFWFFIYYFFYVFYFHYYNFNIFEMLKFLFLGTLESHFYFIIIMMQFYFLMPIWRKICKSIPAFLGIGAAFIITLLFRLYVPNLLYQHFPNHEFYLDRVFFSYFFFWIVGCYIGCNYEKMIGILQKYKAILYLGAILATVHITFSYLNACGTLPYQNATVPHYLFCIIFAIGFYLLVLDAKPIYEKNITIVKNIFSSIFYVYLSHIFFMRLTMKWLEAHQITSIENRFIAKAIATYLLSFGLCYLYVVLKKRVFQGKRVQRRKE